MMAIRPAIQADTPALAALHATGFEGQWSAGAMADLLAMPGSFAFVAEDGDGPRGFVLARAAAGEAEILSVAVHPIARRQGLARALMTAAAKEAVRRGAGHLYLEVAVDNEAALGLYAGLGFAEAGRRKGYYARGPGLTIDALILKMDFPAPA